jgi:hypothetical protein
MGVTEKMGATEKKVGVKYLDQLAFLTPPFLGYCNFS